METDCKRYGTVRTDVILHELKRYCCQFYTIHSSTQAEELPVYLGSVTMPGVAQAPLVNTAPSHVKRNVKISDETSLLPWPV
jgi:hypothetical protein